VPSLLIFLKSYSHQYYCALSVWAFIYHANETSASLASPAASRLKINVEAEPAKSLWVKVHH